MDSGWMDELIDRLMNGWIVDGWIVDGWMDGWVAVFSLCCFRGVQYPPIV